MVKIGYIYSSLDDSYVKKQIEAIKKYKVKKIILEKNEMNTLNRGDQLVIYELRCLGKSITQLPSFFKFLERKEIKLTIINKGKIYSKLTEKQYIDFILEMSEMESFIIKERTTKGIQEARLSGRVGGRPKISEKKIKEIKHLYHTQSYTLRQIAEQCDVSLGTAYKYIQK